MGCKKRHFSFHLAQTTAIVIRYAFVLQKNDGLLNWEEGKENSSNAFPAKIAHLRHWRENMIELFFPLRPQTSTMLNRGSYIPRACANLSRLSQNGTCFGKDGCGGKRGSSVCCQKKKGVVFNHVLEIRCLNFYNIPAVLFRAEKKSV